MMKISYLNFMAGIIGFRRYRLEPRWKISLVSTKIIW